MVDASSIEDTANKDVEPVDEVIDAPVEVIVEKPVASGDIKEFTLSAKKWLFSPNKVVVNSGDLVRLNIEPQGLDFTFSIPDLGVEEEVSGETLIEFTADTVGSFDFKCSSCEDWRGMSGMVVVE
jgi:plastocyanin